MKALGLTRTGVVVVVSAWFSILAFAVIFVSVTNIRVEFVDPNGASLIQDQVRKWVPAPESGQPFGLPISVVVDSGTNQVHLVQKIGEHRYQVLHTIPGTPSQPFNHPVSATFAADSSFVATVDQGNNRIVKHTITATYADEWGGTGSNTGQFKSPSDIAADGDSNLYVSDTGNHRVQKFDSAGNFLSQIGVPGSGNGQLEFPRGLYYDPVSNELHVTESGNRRVQVFNATTGAFIRKYGTGGNGDGQFTTPVAIGVDPNGTSFVADDRGVVQMFDSAGVYQGKFGSPGTLQGQIEEPSQILIDSAGKVFVTSASPNAIPIQNFQPLAHARFFFSRNFLAPELLGPAGLALDPHGFFFMTDASQGKIFCFDSAGRFTGTIGGSRGSAGPGAFNFPFGVAVDSGGYIYVCEYFGNDVAKYDSAGQFVKKWGSQGTGNTQFNGPMGIAVDSSGNLHVTDLGNNRVVKFNSSGTYLSKWGASGTGDALLKSPRGIVFDKANNAFFVTEETAVKKYSGTGTFVGKSGSSGSGDGQFLNPGGLALDAQGFLYVVDSGRKDVQVFAQSTAKAGWGLTSIGKFGTNGTGPGQFTGPWGIVVAPWGAVYVCNDAGLGNLQEWVVNNPPPVEDLNDYLAGEFMDFEWETADLDGDGKITAVDALLLRYNLPAR